MSLNKPNNEIDISTLAQESTSQEIKLSNESIKAVADEILSRMGVTNDTGGGASTGSVFAKLNALLSAGGSGGITGFKYTSFTASRSTRTYTTTKSGILLSYVPDGDMCYIASNGTIIPVLREETITTDINEYIFGAFTSNAQIQVRGTTAHIFEFI